MGIDGIKDVLLWCVLFNYLILLLWSGLFIFARGWMYRLHSRWFKLAPETFDALHYGALALYKIGILLFNLIPWLALCVVL
ncbi:MAG TPA: hypothetical protein VL178_03210 [Pseudomonas sp.]|jgi:hypothetical protein|nr:hypothetical protein [Pseudomonas sp.]